MTTPESEWDAHQKAAENVRNHGVTFDEAVSVFADPLANIFDDPDHSGDERRELIIGHSAEQRLLGRQLYRAGATNSNHQRKANDSA